MLADPIAVDANTPTPALNFRVIRSDGYGSERRDNGGEFAAIINHTTSKNGDRHYVQVKRTVNATNPYSGLVSPQSAAVSVTINKPLFGFTDADLAALYQLVLDTIASDDAGVDRIIAFES